MTDAVAELLFVKQHLQSVYAGLRAAEEVFDRCCNDFAQVQNGICTTDSRIRQVQEALERLEHEQQQASESAVISHVEGVLSQARGLRSDGSPAADLTDPPAAPNEAVAPVPTASDPQIMGAPKRSASAPQIVGGRPGLGSGPAPHRTGSGKKRIPGNVNLRQGYNAPQTAPAGARPKAPPKAVLVGPLGARPMANPKAALRREPSRDPAPRRLGPVTASQTADPAAPGALHGGAGALPQAGPAVHWPISGPQTAPPEQQLQEELRKLRQSGPHAKAQAFLQIVKEYTAACDSLPRPLDGEQPLALQVFAEVYAARQPFLAALGARHASAPAQAYTAAAAPSITSAKQIYTAAVPRPQPRAQPPPRNASPSASPHTDRVAPVVTYDPQKVRVAQVAGLLCYSNALLGIVQALPLTKYKGKPPTKLYALHYTLGKALAAYKRLQPLSNSVRQAHVHAVEEYVAECRDAFQLAARAAPCATRSLPHCSPSFIPALSCPAPRMPHREGLPLMWLQQWVAALVHHVTERSALPLGSVPCDHLEYALEVVMGHGCQATPGSMGNAGELKRVCQARHRLQHAALQLHLSSLLSTQLHLPEADRNSAEMWRLLFCTLLSNGRVAPTVRSMG